MSKSKSNSRFVDYKVVKENVTIVQILEHYSLIPKLRRINDDQFTGTCPIHRGENKTAFRVSISKNCWNCFSQCKCGGNILDFVSRMENVTFHKAAILIAEWFKLDQAFEPHFERMKTDAEQKSLTVSKKESAQPQMTQAKTPAKSEVEDESIIANEPLNFELKHLDAAHPYLQERGLTPETIAMFGLGFCKKGVMQNHVAIPVHNGSGQLVAYAGRWPGQPPNPDEKYRLPKGFRKSLEVFNLHRIAQTDQAKPLIVVEGFFDCMKLWQAGQQRVVSVMGSSVSDQQQAAILKAVEQSRKIVLMFDEDEAGREGREKALQRFASKAYVRVIQLNEGAQPDSLPPEQINSLLLEEAPPAYGAAIAKFRLGRLVATPNALAQLTERDIAVAIGRHSSGDWGDLDSEDKKANERALAEGTRLLSVYHSAGKVKFYLITEADRSVTTILLPEDY